MGHGAQRPPRPDAVRRVIGYMPDSFGVYDDMRAWEYLRPLRALLRHPGRRRKRLVRDLLELVRLAHKRDDYVQALSRGMQQRLCLAHALVHDPPVLLLDEPASGLDPRARWSSGSSSRSSGTWARRWSSAAALLPELEELCTRVAIIDHGRVLAHGEVADIERRLGGRGPPCHRGGRRRGPWRPPCGRSRQTRRSPRPRAPRRAHRDRGAGR
ncbi:MAG: ABC transporter ATP-binding protein [Chloroflexota bacterium]